MSDNQKKVLVDLVKAELNREISEIENIPIGNYGDIGVVSKVAFDIKLTDPIVVVSYQSDSEKENEPVRKNTPTSSKDNKYLLVSIGGRH